MNLRRLVFKEIGHRRGNFALSVAAVAVAAGLLVGALTTVRAHDLQAEKILAEKSALTEKRLAAMEDDYRKYMKELGYNLLVLPADQDMAEFWQSGHADKTMPEKNVQILSEARTELIKHLLPIVQQRVFWPEQKRNIILVGTRGEAPVEHRSPKEPMLLAVQPGKAVIGYQLADDLSLSAGDKLALLGQDFVVESTRPQAGGPGDATIWIDLSTAQRLLKMEGRINAIEALECFCVGKGINELRAEIQTVLPDTQIILRKSMVTIRAQARARAQEEHQAAIAAEVDGRANLLAGRREFAAVLSPLMAVAAGVWVAVLTLSNVRQRRSEIGILQAMGLRSSSVFRVFTVRALIVGTVGAVIGCAGGVVVGVLAGLYWMQASQNDILQIVNISLLVVVLLTAPILSALAGWIPAHMAARQDPAETLREE